MAETGVSICEISTEHTEYLLDDVTRTIQEIFTKYGITSKVGFTTIKKYFGADKIKAKGKEGWILLRKFQPDEEFE